ncbi:hypothetical protein, partial [Vibrio aestuarianus]|uniref:hypothetical protein n=1 Tax=Vibrio aestuarianus TaxID=28171 RepID=UPI00237CB442
AKVAVQLVLVLLLKLSLNFDNLCTYCIEKGSFGFPFLLPEYSKKTTSTYFTYFPCYICFLSILFAVLNSRSFSFVPCFLWMTEPTQEAE